LKKQLFILLATLGIFAGCSSKSNFYQLQPNSGESIENSTRSRHTVVGIAAVEMPDYLTKSELVTRMSAGRLKVHNEEVWAGSLAKNIQSVLQQNLSNLLPSKTFLTYPWEEPIDDKYRIYITIDRFDGYEGGNVALKGRWSLVNKEENSIVYGESINYNAQGGATLDALIHTQSRLLDKLSRRIAQKIRGRI